MSLLTTLFGTPKVVNTVADTVKAGVGMIDEAFYTDQEKAQNALKTWDVWLNIQKTTAQENSIRSVTRRILAWMIIGVFLLLVVSACGLYYWFPEWSAYIGTTISETQLGWLVLAVGTFYFGTYGIGTLVKKE
jgi:hypothetical protein